jgi:hypothetical protein
MAFASIDGESLDRATPNDKINSIRFFLGFGFFRLCIVGPAYLAKKRSIFFITKSNDNNSRKINRNSFLKSLSIMMMESVLRVCVSVCEIPQ